MENGTITERFSEFVNPQVPIPFKIEELTGIRDDMVMGAETIEEILPRFMEFCEGCVMIAHNAEFDMSFIRKNCMDLSFSSEGFGMFPAAAESVQRRSAAKRRQCHLHRVYRRPAGAGHRGRCVQLLYGTDARMGADHQ